MMNQTHNLQIRLLLLSHPVDSTSITSMIRNQIGPHSVLLLSVILNQKIDESCSQENH